MSLSSPPCKKVHILELRQIHRPIFHIIRLLWPLRPLHYSIWILANTPPAAFHAIQPALTPPKLSYPIRHTHRHRLSCVREGNKSAPACNNHRVNTGGDWSILGWDLGPVARWVCLVWWTHCCFLLARYVDRASTI